MLLSIPDPKTSKDDRRCVSTADFVFYLRFLTDYWYFWGSESSLPMIQKGGRGGSPESKKGKGGLPRIEKGEWKNGCRGVSVLHRRAGRRGRLSVVWNHFAPVGAAVNRVRCCCTEGIANGSSCGVQLTTRSTAPLWNHLMYAHPTLYGELRMRNPSVLG